MSFGGGRAQWAEPDFGAQSMATKDGIGDLFEKQGAWFSAGETRELGLRLDRLHALRSLLGRRTDDALEALAKGLEPFPEA